MGYLERYNESHRHPVNRAIHAVGIPAIIISLPLVVVSWPWALGLFAGGWILQFVGHAFEGKPPSFLKDPVYLLVGPYWWLKKLFVSKSDSSATPPSLPDAGSGSSKSPSRP